MKIEWRCVEPPNIPGHIALVASVNGVQFFSAFSWNPEYVKPQKQVLKLAYSSIEQQLRVFYDEQILPQHARVVELLTCEPPPYHGGIWERLDGLSARFAIVDKPMYDKRKPHPSKGPRGRWGNVE